MIESLSSRYPEKTFHLGQVFNDTTNSYKLVWFLGILSLLERGSDSDFAITDVLTEMAAVAWHPVCFFRLSLGRQDKLQEAVLQISKTSLLAPNTDAAAVRDFVAKSDEMQQELEHFRRYVPTRFLAPWFAANLRGVADSRRDRAIVELARKSQTGPLPSPYWVDGDRVRVNASWRRFLLENMAVVRGFVNQHFARYLQGRNPNVPGIVNKMRAPTQRDLKLAQEFWQFVRERLRKSGKAEMFCDIYSQCALLGAFSIDHFLPWSFVAHDLMWNLAPVDRSTNSSKGDALPDLDTYLPRLVSLHAGAIEVAKERPKLLEDYTESFKLDLPALLALGENGLREKYRQVVNPQAQIAINQGFQSGWRLPALITLPELRRRPRTRVAIDNHFERSNTPPKITIERFPSSSDELLPYFSLSIAAGGFRQGYEPEPEGWVDVRRFGYKKRVARGFFVTRVTGRSMEPTITDGAYCVFRADVSGTRQNRIVLVQKRDFTDPETGGGYTVKRYQSAKSSTEEGWKHEQIRLIPDNPDRQTYPILQFSAENEADLQVVAEFVQMLEPSDSPAP